MNRVQVKAKRPKSFSTQTNYVRIFLKGQGLLSTSFHYDVEGATHTVSSVLKPLTYRVVTLKCLPFSVSLLLFRVLISQPPLSLRGFRVSRIMSCIKKNVIVVVVVIIYYQYLVNTQIRIKIHKIYLILKIRNIIGYLHVKGKHVHSFGSLRLSNYLNRGLIVHSFTISILYSTSLKVSHRPYMVEAKVSVDGLVSISSSNVKK